MSSYEGETLPAHQPLTTMQASLMQAVTQAWAVGTEKVDPALTEANVGTVMAARPWKRTGKDGEPGY